MAGIWEVYQARVGVRGSNIRDDTLVREKLRVSHMIQDSLSYHTVLMYDDSIIEEEQKEHCDCCDDDNCCCNEVETNGVKRKVAIINSDNLDEKYVYSLPGEDLHPGDLFYWADNYWLITDRDANNEVYTRTKAIQCNYLLRWVHVQNGEPVIKEQWCYIEDGTKYMTGELEDRHFIATRGDARIAMTIARNQFTVKFNRKSRFLVDDLESDNLLSFDLSKPLKIGHTYNGKGVYKYVLSESYFVPELDNAELGIADYYMYFPEESTDDSGSSDGNAGTEDSGNTTQENTNGKKVWF